MQDHLQARLTKLVWQINKWLPFYSQSCYNLYIHTWYAAMMHDDNDNNNDINIVIIRLSSIKTKRIHSFTIFLFRLWRFNLSSI